MGKTRIVLNRSGVKELLKGPEMQDCVKGLADAAAQRCGPGYESSVMVGKNRVTASVRTVTPEAVKDNYQNNTLLKAVSG